MIREAEGAGISLEFTISQRGRSLLEREPGLRGPQALRHMLKDGTDRGAAIREAAMAAYDCLLDAAMEASPACCCTSLEVQVEADIFRSLSIQHGSTIGGACDKKIAAEITIRDLIRTRK